MNNNILDLFWLVGVALSLGFTFYGAFLSRALPRPALERRALSIHAVGPCAN